MGTKNPTEIIEMDLFSSPSPLHPFQEEEELMHEEMLLWDFSSEPLHLVASAPPLEEPPAAVPRSTFARYVRSDCSSSRTSSERKNIHHRVIELLRGVPRDRSENRSCDQSRGFRHMLRERQRREKLNQSYADLHSMIPCRSKPDKNSIVQSAAAYVRELKAVEEELTRRNEELKMRSARESKSDSDGAKIEIRVANPSSSSPIDSMIGALQCLKAMDVKATAIQTKLSGHELTAILSIESKVGACEVERALMESWR